MATRTSGKIQNVCLYLSLPMHPRERHAQRKWGCFASAPPSLIAPASAATSSPENKAKKQETFEAMVHANRFCPPKALDEEEEAFLAEKDEERRTSEIARKKADKDAEIEYKMAVAQQSGKDDKIDLAKLMGQVC